jgi:anthranilate phosphoribosyltransferase
MDALRGGDDQYNARELLTILRGEPHPARSAIVLNAAAAVVVARGTEPKAATAEVERALSTGRAVAKLEQWRAVVSRAKAS